MRILLVSPQSPDTFWSFRHAIRFIHKRASLPPLGLLTVAAMLPRSWELELVDLNVSRLRDEQIRRADWVMIGAMLVHLESVSEIAARCRALGKPVIGGGPLFTAEEAPPDGIDHVVLGEAEEIAEQLVQDMEAGTVRPLYRVDSYPDVSRTPNPRWDLIKLGHYATMAVQFTRGCPYNCEFCDIVALNGRVPRVKRRQQLIGELESLRLRGWQGATFLVDDNFIGNKRKVKALLRDIIGWRRDTGSRMTFLTEASVNMAEDAELLELMVAAGFKKVFLGIETPDRESLRACHKLQNASCDLMEAVHTIQRAGLEVMGGFIVGFDSDTPDIFERQFEFIQKAGVVTAMVGLLQAVPRTRLYQRLAREGRLVGASLGDNTKAAFNFEPKLDREFLVSNYRRLMERLYEPSAYYQRIRSFLDEHRAHGPRHAPSLAECSALLRAFWVMGVATRGRRAYWRFCASMLLRHPSQFGLGMTLAIYGHHFRQVSRGL